MTEDERSEENRGWLGSIESDGGDDVDPRVVVEFHSSELAEPFRDRLRPDVRITVDSVVGLDDGTHLQYWTVENVAAETILTTVEEFPTTLDARLLSTVGDEHQFEVRGSSESLFATFEAFDGVTKSATYDEDGVYVVAEFPHDTDVEAVARTVHDVYPDLDVLDTQRVEPVSRFRSVVEERLSDRQLAALQIAFFGGYYQQPRPSTGEDLAERMGISKQAFHEHLRKAYATTLEELFRSDQRYVEVDS